MSQLGCRQAIESVLTTYIGDPPIFAENTTVPAATMRGEWARWSIRMAHMMDSDIGAHNERGVGTLYFQHYNKEGEGTKEAWAFADKIGALLNSKHVGTPASTILRFQRAVCTYIGTPDGAIQHNVTVAFQWDAAALNAP